MPSEYSNLFFLVHICLMCYPVLASSLKKKDYFVLAIFCYYLIVTTVSMFLKKKVARCICWAWNVEQ